MFQWDMIGWFAWQSALCLILIGYFGETLRITGKHYYAYFKIIQNT